MESHRIALLVFATIMLSTFVSARAVNISNTWMLPEEDFPVFYRYFRDRISWYEADAVCQFHHANLVTADSTSQYDAIRAYLKELDITENIWIGSSKTTEKPNFTWTDFRPLSGDGHWQQSLPKGNDPLCVSMDPVADFLWKPMACGGPEIASFICELPVPSWAMGPKGCLLTELPSLTVLYIPEQLALELTSDCGLDGTKRIACKGNAVSDREDLLKQLTCAISPDDFDDKSTKSPITSYTASSAVSEISSEDVSSSSKTTKPWIWTSNTIDIDYGMPTRHRRETEDTLSPGSTKSTTDLSTHESHNKNKLTTSISNPSYDTETTSISPERDVTLDSSVSLRSDKPSELKTTQVTDLTTQDVNTQPAETSGSAAATVEPKALEAGVEDTGEYPSAIGQGQLFSIIENGTMFDIIEVNETTSDDLKLDKEIKMETPQSDSEISKTTSTARYSTDHNDNLYTTVVYHKEPPSETSFVTNKSVKKADKHSKKQMFKEKDSKKVNPQIFNKPMNNLENKENDKTLNKEVEMFPIMTDSMVKLNRTHRKELPLIEEDENKAEEENPLKTSTNLNLFNSNEADSVEHQHIEIKWHEGENKNLIHITTKRVDANKKSSTTTKQNIELFNNTEDDRETLHKIDSKIDRLNSIMNSTAANNDTEMFAPPKPEKIQTLPDESMLMKEQFLPKSLLGETKDKPDTTSASLSSNEPLEPEPQAQPRPNRQRQLTRPQRRSFYPYFFSRVLG